MSRTRRGKKCLSHEYWSRRYPRPLDPGREAKRLTKRHERRQAEEQIEEQLHEDQEEDVTAK